ncbi:MAG TPA: hypothetical protein DHW49_07185 [Anaerolineae bacterium]|nr:hypothetical protein [Anaerolineae bacterium]
MIDSSSSAIEQIDYDSNYILGLIAGGAAMLVGAVIWGAITYFTQYQIGYMSIGLGFLVGIAFRFFGKGHSLMFGLSSAVLSLIGCVLGNFLFYVGAIAREESTSFIEVLFFLITNPFSVIELFTIAFDFRDLLFYALAAYVGFRVALDNSPSKPQAQVQQ